MSVLLVLEHNYRMTSGMLHISIVIVTLSTQLYLKNDVKLCMPGTGLYLTQLRFFLIKLRFRTAATHLSLSTTVAHFGRTAQKMMSSFPMGQAAWILCSNYTTDAVLCSLATVM